MTKKSAPKGKPAARRGKAPPQVPDGRRFRSTPVLVEAVKFTGENVAEVQELAPDAWVTNTGSLEVGTPNGHVLAQPGYWVVKDAAGDLSVVLPETFEAEFEPA